MWLREVLGRGAEESETWSCGRHFSFRKCFGDMRILYAKFPKRRVSSPSVEVVVDVVYKRGIYPDPKCIESRVLCD